MPAEDQRSHLFIALFPRAQPGTYDWALANPAAPDDLTPGTTALYRIAVQPYPGGWTKRAATLPAPDDPAAIQPLCLVQLPPIAAPRAELQGFLLEQPAEQGGTPLLSSHQQYGRWSCAQWIVRVLAQLVDAELIELQAISRDPAAFYRRISALGLKAEAEMELDALERGRRTAAQVQAHRGPAHRPPRLRRLTLCSISQPLLSLPP